ncbi:MAG: putative two-component system response regulator [uncultured Chloroflexi bacterium]|uniref:Putative two-component system response regulator n=1 Tax=uncultured Chloroflexota bacterium TaxID=166587 RepID=A0A6J4H0W6_9CHLR|nr:MAG: putative two-component system response regulator [uncultured Chloroflexota bacterium]
MIGGTNFPNTTASFQPMSASGHTQTHVLLVEDDPSVAMTIKDMLESEGYNVRHVDNGARARVAVADPSEPQPDLIILDLMLPDTDGLVLCADLKTRLSAPVIICSASPRKRDAVLGLRLGADDYIAKPFDVEEFLTRVATVLRRAQPWGARPAPSAFGSAPAAAPSAIQSNGAATPSNETHAAPDGTFQPATGGSASSSAGGAGSVAVGPLSLEHARRRVAFAGEELQLTPTEYRLLATFMARPDEVLSRQELAQVVWGYEDASIGRSIDVHVHRLRTKLLASQEQHGIPGPSVVSVRGFGYKLLEDVSCMAA